MWLFCVCHLHVVQVKIGQQCRQYVFLRSDCSCLFWACSHSYSCAAVGPLVDSWIGCHSGCGCQVPTLCKYRATAGQVQRLLPTGALPTGSTGEEYRCRLGLSEFNSKAQTPASPVFPLDHSCLRVRCSLCRSGLHPGIFAPSTVGRRGIAIDQYPLLSFHSLQSSYP